MSEISQTQAADARIQDYLASLPDTPQARDLWSRIDGSRRRRRAYRRLATASFGLAMLVIVLGGGRAWQQAQRGEMLALQPSTAIDLGAVQAIDRQLQQAYDRTAAPEEIQYLWQARALAIPTEASKEPDREHILSL